MLNKLNPMSEIYFHKVQSYFSSIQAEVVAHSPHRPYIKQPPLEMDLGKKLLKHEKDDVQKK